MSCDQQPIRGWDLRNASFHAPGLELGLVLGGVVETTTPVPFLHFSTFRKQYASLYVLAIIFQ